MEFRQLEDQNKDHQFSDTIDQEDEEQEQEQELEDDDDIDEEHQQEENQVILSTTKDTKTNNYMNLNTTSTNYSTSTSHQNLNLSFSAGARNWPEPPPETLSLRSGTVSGGAGQREHMFDKVVTPSDVGKLNRLVIPKQHAEKYFPLDSSSTEKGLLLNFEDGGGKSWRFRYSYWNSSQSYVMTKGWSRFVKDKKLDPGDVVSFLRDSSDIHRLFIDWRRRPHQHNSSLFFSGRGINYPLAPPPPHFPHYYGVAASHQYQYPYHHHHQPQQQQQQQQLSYMQNSNYYRHQHNHSNQYYELGYGCQAPMGIGSVIESSVVAAPKRLRLFGVNMEYSPNEEDFCNRDLDRNRNRQEQQVRLLPNSNNNMISPVVFPIMPLLPTSNSGGSSSTSGGFLGSNHKGKSSANNNNNSLSFDLDP